MQDVDDEFYQRADEHINLSNEQVTDEIGRGKVSASFMFGLARYNAFVSASSCNSKEEMIKDKKEAVEYFVSEYQKMFEENYEDYVDNFEKYIKTKSNPN